MARKRSPEIDQLVQAVAFFKVIREDKTHDLDNPIVEKELGRIKAKLKDDLFQALNRKMGGTA